MGKVIKEIRNTIAGHQILIFDDEWSYTLTRGEHEILKLKVGDEYPPAPKEFYVRDGLGAPVGTVTPATAEQESKPAQEQLEKLEPDAGVKSPEQSAADLRSMGIDATATEKGIEVKVPANEASEEKS